MEWHIENGTELCLIGDCAVLCHERLSIVGVGK